LGISPFPLPASAFPHRGWVPIGPLPQRVWRFGFFGLEAVEPPGPGLRDEIRPAEFVESPAGGAFALVPEATSYAHGHPVLGVCLVLRECPWKSFPEQSLPTHCLLSLIPEILPHERHLTCRPQISLCPWVFPTARILFLMGTASGFFTCLTSALSPRLVLSWRIHSCTLMSRRTMIPMLSSNRYKALTSGSHICRRAAA
jgi:hypothetical protein